MTNQKSLSKNKPSIDVGGDNISDKGGKRGMEQVLHWSPSTARVSPKESYLYKQFQLLVAQLAPFPFRQQRKDADFEHLKEGMDSIVAEEKQKSFEEGKREMMRAVEKTARILNNNMCNADEDTPTMCSSCYRHLIVKLQMLKEEK